MVTYLPPQSDMSPKAQDVTGILSRKTLFNKPASTWKELRYARELEQREEERQQLLEDMKVRMTKIAGSVGKMVGDSAADRERADEQRTAQPPRTQRPWLDTPARLSLGHRVVRASAAFLRWWFAARLF